MKDVVAVSAKDVAAIPSPWDCTQDILFSPCGKGAPLDPSWAHYCLCLGVEVGGGVKQVTGRLSSDNLKPSKSITYGPGQLEDHY